MTHPTIDNTPLQLGDVLRYPTQGGIFTNGRLKGWSPCGRWLYVAWCGVIEASLCEFEDSLAASQFARLYNPVRVNCWLTAVAWGSAADDRRVKDSANRGCQ